VAPVKLSHAADPPSTGRRSPIVCENDWVAYNPEVRVRVQKSSPVDNVYVTLTVTMSPLDRVGIDDTAKLTFWDGGLEPDRKAPVVR
jgi:hypothetical protein